MQREELETGEVRWGEVTNLPGQAWWEIVYQHITSWGTVFNALLYHQADETRTREVAGSFPLSLSFSFLVSRLASPIWWLAICRLQKNSQSVAWLFGAWLLSTWLAVRPSVRLSVLCLYNCCCKFLSGKKWSICDQKCYEKLSWGVINCLNLNWVVTVKLVA